MMIQPSLSARVEGPARNFSTKMQVAVQAKDGIVRLGIEQPSRGERCGGCAFSTRPVRFLSCAVNSRRRWAPTGNALNRDCAIVHRTVEP